MLNGSGKVLSVFIFCRPGRVVVAFVLNPCNPKMQYSMTCLVPGVEEYIGVPGLSAQGAHAPSFTVTTF